MAASQTAAGLRTAAVDAPEFAEREAGFFRGADALFPIIALADFGRRARDVRIKHNRVGVELARQPANIRNLVEQGGA
jgi:hypothetical protein